MPQFQLSIRRAPQPVTTPAPDAALRPLTHLPPPQALRGEAATPTAFIHAILLAYRKYGRNPARALTLSHLQDHDLAQAGGCVTAGQLEMMSAVAMQELDDEALGWFSRPLPWGSYGMLCRASLTAPDLATALGRWCRHHSLLTRDVGLELLRQGETAQLRLHAEAVPAEFREFCILSCLRYALGYACWAVDSRIDCLSTVLPCAAPPHAAFYSRLFDCAVRFDGPHAAIEFDASYLGLPLRRNEADMGRMLRRALPLTVHRYRRDRALMERASRLLAEQPELNAEAVAGALNLSLRSLHRRLAEEGSSLLKLKDQARYDKASQLLRRTRKPIKQIALEAGFQNEKSFSRAFKTWSGHAPGAFRRGN